MYKIGFMQGRLIKSEKKNFVQSFPWKNWKKEFYIAKENKIRLMEWTIDYFNFEKNPLINKNQTKLIKKLKKKNNLDIQSVTCDFYMHKPFTKARSSYLKKKIYRNVITLIHACKELKINKLIFPLVDNSSLKNFDDEKKTISFFLKFNKLLKLYNIKILFEIDFNPKKILKFIGNFDKYYGINYDSGNSASLGFDITEEQIYFHRVKNIHIKDRLYGGTTVKLGNGDCNFSKLFKIIKKSGYKENLILQTAKTWKKNEIGEIIDNINFIKKFY